MKNRTRESLNEEKLVDLTEKAKQVADDIGRPVARAAYHLEAARLEAEAAAGAAARSGRENKT